MKENLKVAACAVLKENLRVAACAVMKENLRVAACAVMKENLRVAACAVMKLWLAACAVMENLRVAACAVMKENLRLAACAVMKLYSGEKEYASCNAEVTEHCAAVMQTEARLIKEGSLHNEMVSIYVCATKDTPYHATVVESIYGATS